MILVDLRVVERVLLLAFCASGQKPAGQKLNDAGTGKDGNQTDEGA
ncbi:hypothetical protein [Pararhizobium qamdonense]|nr:hypothetical protein [Pararhizobium qamdonense]